MSYNILDARVVNENNLLPIPQISVFVGDETGMINRVAGVVARRGARCSCCLCMPDC